MRPWLIVDERGPDIFGCFPIASESYGDSGFPLNKSRPDFRATGFEKDCYVIDSKLYDLPRSAFCKKRGELVGELLADFRKFSGV
jgi:hypothetical protein